MLEYCDDHIKFIISIIRKVKVYFSDFNLNDDDLYQRGWLELIKAYYDYDESKGAKFTTYAYYRIINGIKEEAFSQIDNGISTTNFKVLEFINLDDAELNIADESYVDSEDDSNEISRAVRQLLTQEEFMLLCSAFGIDCEQCADPKKLARRFGMSVLEVRKALESGKTKLRALYGRK